ncbi:3-hydroxyacyl-CoA dehydrogenase NAD-binding domain-containing protein, partial [Effusibacillus lacus]
MAMEKIRTIAVIGAGAMGSQIAMLCALAGFKTYLQDIS